MTVAVSSFIFVLSIQCEQQTDPFATECPVRMALARDVRAGLFAWNRGRAVSFRLYLWNLVNSTCGTGKSDNN
ncbi:hypothetical protein [Nostoc sp.]|uniref:hypothetical protein n=1 Tax=Nostoc sp. TaxID=1180 RepID=UPI002FF85FCA